MTDANSLGIVIASRCSWTMYNFRLPLIRSLMADGFAVKAVGAGGDGYDVKLRAAGVDFEDVPVSRKGIAPIKDVLLTLQLIGLFRRARPKVFHAFTIKPAIYGTWAAAIAGVPVRVVTITGLGHAFTTASGLLRQVVEILYRHALKRASLVYFQNADDRALFLERGLVDANKTRLIPGSGVDTARFGVAALPSASDGKIRFLMVARLLREKGVQEYFDAADRVKAAHPEAEFVLLGGLDSRNPSALSRADVDKLTDRGSVRWVDEVPDVRPYLAACDVIVLPSFREGMPRAVLEAAAVGRAAIVTDVPGCRDAVEADLTGLIIPPANSEALAVAMKRFVEEPSLASSMGAAARCRVVARFDEKGVIKETTSAYLEMIAKE
jgi:glycosyltransferase involved in cell wall biosynthesis